MNQRQKRYWDSSVFLAFFNEEKSRIEKCKPIIELAESGKLIIVTSTFSLVEVVNIKGEYPKLNKEKEEIISQFFKHSYIHTINCDRLVATEARKLIWNHNLKPKDAVHLASALINNIQFIDSFDKDFSKLDGRFGNPKIKIGEPNIPYQTKIFNQYSNS